MKSARIQGSTRCLGKPRDWDDTLDGACGALYIRDGLLNGSSCMVSEWYPSTEELKALAEGKPIHLYIVGHIHPVVMLAVGD